MTDHDAIYHRLFAHPEMVRELLVGFVDAPWVGQLDFGRMERVNARFHSPGLERRDGDVIWRIGLRDGSEIYLYVLLEFQSAPDRWMALRVLVYVGLLWQQLVGEQRLGPDGRLPPVFPLVLYNGEGRWRRPVDLAALVALPEGSELWPWQPGMRYHLIDEGSYPPDRLARGETLAALLFAFETAPSPVEALPVVEQVAEWFRRHPGSGELRRAFTAFLADSLAPGGDAEWRETDLLAEGPGMLATRIKEWKQQLLLEGRQEGRHEGAARVLRRQLERRFGSLPAAALARLQAADDETLERWSLRVLEARSLDEVLA